MAIAYNIQQIFFFSDLSYPLLSHKQLQVFFDKHYQHCVFHSSRNQEEIPILIPTKYFINYTLVIKDQQKINSTLLKELCPSLYIQNICLLLNQSNSSILLQIQQERQNECLFFHNTTRNIRSRLLMNNWVYTIENNVIYSSLLNFFNSPLYKKYSIIKPFYKL